MKTSLLECTSKNTMYLPPTRGGLGLVNVKLKSDALMLNCILRGLAGERGPTICGILKYFLGFHLRDWLQFDGPRAELGAPPLFRVSLPLIREAVPHMYTPKQICIASAKYIYSQKIEDLSEAKIESRYDLSVTRGGWKQVWSRLSSPVFDLECRDIYYKLLHDRLPTQERLFHKNKTIHMFEDKEKDCIELIFKMVITL